MTDQVWEVAKLSDLYDSSIDARFPWESIDGGDLSEYAAIAAMTYLMRHWSSQEVDLRTMASDLEFTVTILKDWWHDMNIELRRRTDEDIEGGE